MAIQDLINEVNSIQTKKQSIKEAITAKGVTSEGKLSKFADEIKQISTGEPDWYMINRIRLPDGKESLLVRTNVRDFTNIDIKQLTEMGGGVYNESNSLRARVEPGFHIINGSFFLRKESLAVYNETHEDVNISSDTHNDNYKFTYSFDGKPNKEVIFNDVNSYNYLKPFQNKPLLDRAAVYLKCTPYESNSVVSFNSTKDIINTSAKPQQFQTADISDKPIEVMPIDSTMFIIASQPQAIVAAGFVNIETADGNKTMSKIMLKPVDQTFHSRNLTTDSIGTVLYRATEWYNSLPMGNYIYIIATGSKIYAVFIGINYVVNSDGLKEKNIEVYPYFINTVSGYNYINGKMIPNVSDININSFNTATSIEWYINLNAADTVYNNKEKILRRKVLIANGTPEPRESNFLTGKDALLAVNTAKMTNNKMPVRIDTYNLFRRDYRNIGSIARYSNSDFTMFNGGRILKSLKDDITANNKIAGFISLNDDSNTMFPIELEQATNEIINNNTSIQGYQNRYSLACIAPNGIPNKNNKMVVFISNDRGPNYVQAFYIKKGNDYITNDMLSTALKYTYLYLTSDAETQKYLTTKPLSDIWTEIINLNKEDFEAYSEE